MNLSNEEAGTMRHHIVYWRMAKRETDVDDTELAILREQERRGEVYIEFLDEMRLPLTWNHEAHNWEHVAPERTLVAA